MLGAADCVLAFGFEQMMPGALGAVFKDRKGPMEIASRKFLEMCTYDPTKPPAPQFFGAAGLEYQKRYGASDETFAMISVKVPDQRAESAPQPDFWTAGA